MADLSLSPSPSHLLLIATISRQTRYELDCKAVVILGESESIGVSVASEMSIPAWLAWPIRLQPLPHGILSRPYRTGYTHVIFTFHGFGPKPREPADAYVLAYVLICRLIRSGLQTGMRGTTILQHCPPWPPELGLNQRAYSIKPKVHTPLDLQWCRCRRWTVLIVSRFRVLTPEVAPAQRIPRDGQSGWVDCIEGN